MNNKNSRYFYSNKEEFLKNIKKFQGILNPGEGKSLLKELRRTDLEREKITK